MPITATTAITGKSVTFTFGALDGSAQVTSSSVEKTASSNTIQTYTSSVTVAQGQETKVTCDFLFDGDQVAGFYAALDAAFVAGTEGALDVEAGAGSWTGQALVTALSTAMPADDAVTCTAELTISGDFPFTGPAGP
jgi:hypothetical protein